MPGAERLQPTKPHGPGPSRVAAKSRFARWRSAADPASASAKSTLSLLAIASAALLLLSSLLHILGPMLADFHTFGFHDWDAETSYRYVSVLSLKKYGEGPWWNPWLCGGVPAFGDAEAASNFLSPYLPLYLLTDVRVAFRIEVIGAALTGLSGAFLLARRFSKSAALCGFLAALYVLNGRWALQAAAGHTWHLQYGLLPWAFFFYERALEPGRLRNVVGAGVALACMVLWGGIYPLPQAALLLSVYSLLLALGLKSTRPLLVLALAGLISIGLAAPKLFAIIDHMSDVPRLIESREVIGLAELLVMFTSLDQRFGSRPTRVPAYNWHEWGIYIGPLGVLSLLVALVFARGARGQALKITGMLCLLLGFGAFNPYAPWALLHPLPVFASQHVPSRFHYPMLLLLGLAFLTVLGPRLDRLIDRAPWLDLLLLLPLSLFCRDLARVAREPMEQAFWMEMPDRIESRPFEQHVNAVVNYKRRDWAVPQLLAMMANTGIIKGYGVDTAFVPAAVGRESPVYRGTVYLEAGPGTTQLSAWSPSHAEVTVQGASPGSLVVYNMNYDSSWRANGAPAIDYQGLVAARLESGTDRVTFRYFPRTLWFSIPLSLLTLSASAWLCRFGLPRWARKRWATRRELC
jgi:hypothetical protein